VAKMAGMPKKVLDRANLLLAQLEGQRDGSASKEKTISSKKAKPVIDASDEAGTSTDAGMQLSFFQLNDPVLENIKDELERTDINTLTPVEALMKLNEIKKMIGG
jgi:DNA mismatch repair protein MutS